MDLGIRKSGPHSRGTCGLQIPDTTGTHVCPVHVRIFAVSTLVVPHTLPYPKHAPMEACAALSEALLLDDVSAHRTLPSDTALVTSEGNPIRARLGANEECLRAQPAALFPAPGYIRLCPDDLRVAARQTAFATRSNPSAAAAAAAAAAVVANPDSDRCVKALVDPHPCPIGFTRCPTGLDQYARDCLAGAPAGLGAWREGGAVFADPLKARGIASLALLRTGPTCGVEAAERQKTCAVLAEESHIPLGDHVCVLMGTVREKDAHKCPCPRDRRPTCAAIAHWLGEPLERHACVRRQLENPEGEAVSAAARQGILDRAAVAACPASVLCADAVGDAQRKAFLMASCMQFWFAIRGRWVYNTHTNRFLVSSNMEELKVDAALVYVYLAAALGYALVDPDAPAGPRRHAGHGDQAAAVNGDDDDDKSDESESNSEESDADARAAIRALSAVGGGRDRAASKRSRASGQAAKAPARRKRRKAQPPPRVGVASEAVKPHLRLARACQAADGSGVMDMMRLDEVAAQNLPLQAFVVFVAQRLFYASAVDPLSAVRASGRHTWIGAPPEHVLAPGRHYPTNFFDEGAWGKQARSSKDYFAQRGWAPQGLDPRIQHLTHCVNETHEPSALPSNLFKRPDFGTVMDLDAIWWFEHLWIVPTQPLVDLHDPLRRGRVQTSDAFWNSVAPPAELAATRVWIALQAFIMSPSDAAECGQHLSNTAIGRQVRSAARPVAIRAKRTATAAAAVAAEAPALSSPVAKLPTRRRRSKATVSAAAAAIAATSAVPGAISSIPDVDTGSRAVLGGCTTHANVLHYGFVLRSETQPTPDPTRLAFTRYSHARPSQGSEMVFMPPGSRPRPVDVSASRILRANPYHPTEQCPVRLANAFLETGLFDANALDAIPFTASDRAALRGGAGFRASSFADADALLARQIDAPSAIRRLHARMLAAVRFERDGARQMLGDAYNFLACDNPGALVFAFPLAARAGLTVAETWLILLFYQWVRSTSPLWTSTESSPIVGARAAGTTDDDGDDDMPVDSDGDPRASHEISRGLIPPELAHSPALPPVTTTFVPAPAVVDVLLRRLACAWDMDVLRVFGFTDEAPTDDDCDAIGAQPGPSRLSRFILDLLGETNERDLSRWAFTAMTRERFPPEASRQYGPELDRLARDVAERYVARAHVLRRILGIHGAALFERNPDDPTAPERPIDIGDIALPEARIPFSLFNSNVPIEQATVRANDMAAAIAPARERVREQIRARDAKVELVAAAVRAWLLDGRDTDGTAAGIQRDPMRRVSAETAPTEFVGGRFVVRLRACGTAMSTARVAHWMLHGVVRPAVHLILWVLYPPVAPPVPIQPLTAAASLAAGFPSPRDAIACMHATDLARLTCERVETAWGDKVAIQRHWWPRHHFATMHDAALRQVGSKLLTQLRAIMRRIQESEGDKASAADTAQIMLSCARSDRVAAHTVLAIAACVADADEQAAASSAADGGGGRRQAIEGGGGGAVPARHAKSRRATARMRGNFASVGSASADGNGGNSQPPGTPAASRFWNGVGSRLREGLGITGSAQRLLAAVPEARARDEAARAEAAEASKRTAEAEAARRDVARRTDEASRRLRMHQADPGAPDCNDGVLLVALLRKAQSEVDIDAWVRMARLTGTDETLPVFIESLVVIFAALGFQGRTPVVVSPGLSTSVDAVCKGLRTCAALRGATFSVAREDAFAMQQHRIVAEDVYQSIAEVWASPLGEASRSTLRSSIRALLKGCIRAGATRGRGAAASSAAAASGPIPLRYPPLAEPRGALTLALVFFAKRHLADSFEVTIDATEGISDVGPAQSLPQPSPPRVPVLSARASGSGTGTESSIEGLRMLAGAFESPRPPEIHSSVPVPCSRDWTFRTPGPGLVQSAQPAFTVGMDATVQQRIDTVCNAAKVAIHQVSFSQAGDSADASSLGMPRGGMSCDGAVDISALVAELGVSST